MLIYNKCRLLIMMVTMGLVMMISCTSPSKVVYFNNFQDTAIGIQKDSLAKKLHIGQYNFENLIQKNDQLWITVGGSNINDLLIINSANGVPAGTATSTLPQGGSSTGYVVESDGKIKLPYLGSIKAEGLTRLQLESFLAEKLKDFTKDPVVNVRFLNYGFSVMGEVTKPGKYPMVTERTTILEALSMAGDLSDMGKRESVLVIREVNGQREFARVNLLSKDIFTSPYYYLKTNDVIYVEPAKARFINRTGIPQYLGIAAVGISLLITIINLVK